MIPGERYVLIGLTRDRAPWFTELAGWATSGVIAAEFVKALTVDEVRALLASGRQYSAVLLDASVPGWDRDTGALAAARGCAVLVVDDDPPRQSWQQLGVQAVLSRQFDRERLLAVLGDVARPVRRAHDAAGVMPAASPGAGITPVPAERAGPVWQGTFVGVTGPPGTGRSTLALALAGGFAADPRVRGSVVLADLALHAQQGLLHDAGDVVPGLSELVEAHRRSEPPADVVRGGTFRVGHRGYDLLLGLRRHHDWTALRRTAIESTLTGLCAAYRLVVADVDADVEGEADTGLMEVEERNQLARSALLRSDLVVVVGRAGLTGFHAQVRVLADLHRLGVPGRRLLVVVNQARRSPRRRAEVAAALQEVLGDVAPGLEPPTGPIFVGERRGLDDVIADGGQMPTSISAPLVRAARASLERLPARVGDGGRRRGPEPVAITPGSIGRWTERTGEHAS